MTHARRGAFGALLLLAALSGPALAAGNAPPAPAVPGAQDDGKAFDLPRVGRANQVEMIAGLCQVQMKNLSPLGCKCLAEEAMTDLSDPQRDYLMAAVVAPPVADRMLKDGRVAAADQGIIFSFLNKTSDACASGVFKPLPGPAPAVPAAPPAK